MIHMGIVGCTEKVGSAGMQANAAEPKSPTMAGIAAAAEILNSQKRSRQKAADVAGSKPSVPGAYPIASAYSQVVLVPPLFSGPTSVTMTTARPDHGPSCAMAPPPCAVLPSSFALGV